MENSKVKAQFFAMYLGQNILNTKGWENTPCLLLTALELAKINDDRYLLLRTVEQLTDDELAVVKEILSTKEKPNPTDIEIGQYCTHYYSYLILIGVLLPFTFINEQGKPETLQPDEIVARGWAKIKND